MGSLTSPVKGQGRVVLCSDQEKLDLLNKYDGFCFDLDGTIWKGSTLIPGVLEVLTLLRQLGKKIFFVTNNSSKSRAAYAAKMAKLGLKAQQSEIYGSSYAAAMFLKRHNIEKVYCVGEAGMVDELSSVGITALGGPADSDKSWDWSGEQDPELTLDTEVKAVLVGLDRAVNYYKLQTAHAYIRNQKTIFVATNTDSHGNLASNQEWAGAGTMVGAVAAATEMEPFVVGKPQRALMDLICEDSKLQPSRLCVIGDRIDTDILWAKTCGAGSLLVLTGCTSEDMLGEDRPPVQAVSPLFYVHSLADLLTIKDKVAAVSQSSWGTDSCTIS